MVYLFSRWIISAFALIVTAWILPGVEVSSLFIALITVILFGLVNTIVRPVLVVLTLPITIVTLGLFIFVLNGLLFWFVASFVDGFQVDGFLSAVAGALLVSVMSYLGNWLVIDRSDKENRQENTSQTA